MDRKRLLAHAHHAYDVYTSNGRTSQALKVALGSSGKGSLLFSFDGKTTHPFLCLQLSNSHIPPCLAGLQLTSLSRLVSALPFVWSAPQLTRIHTLHFVKGSILPPLSAHIFCNVMSLPTISYALQKHPERKWDILATYMLGVVGFCWLLPKI